MRGVTAVIAAGGRGRRFGGDLPKQFAPLEGAPVLARTMLIFERLDYITGIYAAVPEGFEDFTREMAREYQISKLSGVAAGGENRQASVYNALRLLSAETDIVLIHDGARPFVTERVIRGVIECVERGFSAAAGIRATDTVKITDKNGAVISTPDREYTRLIQTPQGFTYKVIMAAHEQAARDGYAGTDDASLAERLNGAPVIITEGDRRNIKLTEPEDLILGAALTRL